MNAERLLQLADHLEHGKLGHEHFNFATYHCGSEGCAIGECPTLWPNDWEMRDGVPMLTGMHLTSGRSAQKWFDLGTPEYWLLFVPRSSVSGSLSLTATKEEVAQNIRKFVAGKIEAK